MDEFRSSLRQHPPYGAAVSENPKAQGAARTTRRHDRTALEEKTAMVSLKLQKRLAASILNCGARKIWMDPNEVGDDLVDKTL